MNGLLAITSQEASQKVPITRMDRDDPELMEEILAAVAALAHTGRFTLGEEVERFEREFAAYCDSRHAVGVASGTDALVLALRALEIGAGDEVIVPTNSFIASAEAISLVGATPRFADVDPRTATLTAETLEAAVTPETTAVIVVHLYGRTADMDSILKMARSARLKVVEDACQAHGARYRGRRVGSLGDIGCFSFYPSKNLGAWGDGGAITTDSSELADRVTLLRSHGERPRYSHSIVGTTARLDAIQAAVLRVKLPRLDRWNADRRRVAARLTDGLVKSGFAAPAPTAPGADHVFHQYVVDVVARDEFRAHLEHRGVASAVHYPVPIHRSPAYGDVAGGVRLPIAEALAERVCSLPMFPSMTDQMIDQVIDAVCSFDAGAVERRRESWM